jgi:hypothetical protein
VIRALALVLALAACGPGERSGDLIDGGGPLTPDARFDGTLSLSVDGQAYAIENTVASYRGQPNAVFVTAEVRCPGCASAGTLTIALRADGPTDCSIGSGIDLVDADIFAGGIYASTEVPCDLVVDAYGTDFGARVAGRFDGTLELDEIGEPMTLRAQLAWDVTL